MRSCWIGLGALVMAAGCAADGVGNEGPQTAPGEPIAPNQMMPDGGDPDGEPTPPAPRPDPGPDPLPGVNPGGGNGSGKKCDELFVRATPTIPEMLIVMDKSSSMRVSGEVDRWGPSVSAIDTITQGLEDRVRFGLMPFPQRGGVGCRHGEVAVDPALMNHDRISELLGDERPNGGATPIAGTLLEALDYFDQPLAPDEVKASTYVLLLTDGAPSCKADGEGVPLFDPQPVKDAFYEEARLDTYAAMDSLAAANIPTYVIGYDTQNVPELAMVLDEMARRGGTGDTNHRPVEDEASLLAEIESIAGQIVSCTYDLSEPPGDPTFVRVTLDGTDIPMGDQGWQLRGETTIEMAGAACDTLRDKQEHTLNIVVECAPVVIQ